MTRSAWKGKFIYNFLLENKFIKRKKKLNIWTRNSTIPSKLLGKDVFVHNGKQFHRVHITREKVGFKFGQFSYTRSLPPKKEIKANKAAGKKSAKK